ncbi:hypothetical protein [Bradymonas sediminis]|uniref:Uncharacterized protein n=1 Tax=Bradymonas sediminis TaxID=1548548 RepID=A0A2Z4FK01_9DELT|nr:hypothetical protein [Bradymonas sediminis]AWV89282.1 hypothetical protein DN745_08005 [Bradymonas sediminis]TDP73455.1 hypothetical protein DFR33_10695 [Bradymonas sediminis]
MMRGIAPIYLLFIGLFLVTGCTNAKLEKLPAKAALQRDDKLAISGEICTLDPETLTFPLRVIFVVDSSVSMEITDPPDPITGETGRERAVRETWTRLLDQGAAGARFSVIRFSSQAQPLTGTDLNGDGAVDTYFSADRARLSQATQALGVTDRTTNYINALGEAYYEIRTELVQAEQESLPLSNYQVIFLSDGLPDVDSTEDRGNSNENILEAVEALRELTETFKVGKFGFHTAYLASQNATFNEQATSLLQGMADVGGGNFRSFPNGEQLNFLFVDFTVLKRIFTLRALIGTNQNAVLSVAQIPEWAKKPEPVEEEPTPDAGDGDITEDDAGADVSEESDADGDAGADSDVEEVVVPTLHPYSFSDINGDGYPGCGEPLSDTDGDGLSDMAELALGSDPLVPDTDDDGLSDFLEWSYRESGFDLLDPSDARCYVPEVCENPDENGVCECLFDANSDGICDCVDDPNLTCVDDIGSDCVDLDADGFCDCPDLNNDGRCDYEDSDNDGLNDCEEVFYGSAQNGVDSDADGLPDRIEVRFGTSPVENDLNGDLDADSTSNGIEVLSNTDPLCDDSETRSRGAYQYELNKTGIDAGRTCYTFKVENITLLPTLENPAATYPGNGWNRILVYAGGVAFDSPNSFARYRVACVMANYYPDGNYRNPPSGRVQLDESDFVEVADFNADEDCKWP